MPGVSYKVGKTYVRLLDLPFEDGELLVRIYVRFSDFRARILCRTYGRDQAYTQSSRYITNLKITRSGSCLELFEQQNEKNLETSKMWAILNFPTYERMTLFYCSFVALKAQDEGHSIRDLDNDMLTGETLCFSGVLIDDDYEHKLKVYSDPYSTGIRLVALPGTGSLKK